MKRKKKNVNEAVDNDLDTFGETKIVDSAIAVAEEAKPAVEREKVEEAEYTAEIIKDYGGQMDPFYIPHPDKNFAYRYLRFEPKNLSKKTSNVLFMQGGWQLCPQAHLLRIGFKERELGPDTFRHVGDNVLAFMPKKLFDEKMAQKQKDANAPMEAVTRFLKEGDPALAGLGHPNMRGIQDKDSLKGNWKE